MPLFCFSWVHCHGYLSCTLVTYEVFLSKWDYMSLDIMYSRSKSKKKERKNFGLVWIFQGLPHGSILHQKDGSVDCATHSNVACIFSYRGTSASRHQTHMGSTSNGHSYFLSCQLGGSTSPPLVGNRSKFCALLHWQPSLSSGQVVCTIAFVHSVIHSGAAFFSRWPS